MPASIHATYLNLFSGKLELRQEDMGSPGGRALARPENNRFITKSQQNR
jgi:hypothetical protein